MSAPRSYRNLVLAGFMGTGKTTVGRLVAAQLHFNFLDTDVLIEERAGKSIADIFAQDGEPHFRELEQKVVADLPRYDQTVIATGGGMTADAANLASLKAHALVVCLWASPETIWTRVQHQSHRPLLQGPDPIATIRGLLAARLPLYKQADALVSVENRSMKEVVQHVVHHFRLAHRQCESA